MPSIKSSVGRYSKSASPSAATSFSSAVGRLSKCSRKPTPEASQSSPPSPPPLVSRWSLPALQAKHLPDLSGDNPSIFTRDPLASKHQPNGPKTPRSLGPAQPASRSVRLLVRQLNHPPLRIAKIRIRPHCRDNDAPPPQLPQNALPVFHRNIKMKITDIFPVLALANR